MLEIYNETIRDLLSPSCSSSPEGKLYSIKHDANGNTVVSDLTLVDVCSEQAAQSLYQAACSRWQHSSTVINCYLFLDTN